jgi:Fe-S-cluster-containing hydrogenase component 2
MAAKVDAEKCTGCSACVEVCPVDAIKMEDEKAVIGDECIECGVCVSQCPVEAISL